MEPVPYQLLQDILFAKPNSEQFAFDDWAMDNFRRGLVLLVGADA